MEALKIGPKTTDAELIAQACADCLRPCPEWDALSSPWDTDQRKWGEIPPRERFRILYGWFRGGRRSIREEWGEIPPIDRG